MQNLLYEVVERNRPFSGHGQVATYIPALAKASPSDVGICAVDMNGIAYGAGEYEKKFTIQSVSKAITLMLSIMDNGSEHVFSRVGVEPTGDPFNSIIKLETTKPHRPHNPMINAGAIAVASMIKGENQNHKLERLLNFVRKLTNNNDIDIDEEVYISERETGNKNRALAYYMKNEGIIDGNVEETIDLYFKQCSILVTCRDLANIAAVLASKGVSPINGERIIPENITTIVKTLMLTCGMYDDSGNFALRVGLPAKSGVGGGIIAIVPNNMGIATFGPSLDSKGNSIVGMMMLEELSRNLELNIFQ
ncbi:glutaminase A [uncultured Ilyobacter sp.]|uniref:glutaminase A n=1 Tax=uncultured Ilyobacter sp. TaxID=544433 RepID=UPI0029C97054|nr:glutaminase A [uncultured Ilyobacter sp.]